MNYIFINVLILANVILCYLVIELWKSNKKKNEIIRLQDNWLKQEGIIKKY
jgi:regulatory protein YycI of two-component signal transduction system YycFG